MFGRQKNETNGEEMCVMIHREVLSIYDSKV